MWVCYKHNTITTFLLFITLAFGACNSDDDDGLGPPSGPLNPMDSTLEDSIPVNSGNGQTDTLHFNYLALGDSYTIGTGLSDASGRFPVQLANRLSAEPLLAGDAPRIIAQNGWTTASLLSGINTANIDTTYSLVSLLIGVNNQFQNKPMAEYSEQFTNLLEQAIGYAAGDTARVFVVSIPDYGVTPFGQNYNPAQVATAIDAFNAMSQSITVAYGVSYYNITEISREVSSTPGMLAPDNLHPSAQQYGLWVNEFYEHVKLKLNE
jgi:lysophospholipase L1-like esterase